MVRVCSYPTRKYKTYQYSPKIINCDKHEWKEIEKLKEVKQ